ILEQRAKFRLEMRVLKAEIADLRRAVSRLGASAEADHVSAAAVRAQATAYWAETRGAINNLTLANEATRKLAEDVARLTVQTSRRVTRLESEVFDKGAKDA